MISPESLAASGTEHANQSALFCWAAKSGIKELKYMFAIPNGGFRGIVTAARLKAEGVKPGVPDIFLPVPRKEFAGLFIELKTKKGIVSCEQDNWIKFLRDQHYKADVCYGWEEARDMILEYLG